MTLEEFTILRRDELVAFFKARFGYYWRRIVTRQAGLHPRSFQRFKSEPPLSLYRLINRLEKWARSIGFTSPVDEKVAARLIAHREFREAAQAEIDAVRKRKELAREEEPWDRHEMHLRIIAALQESWPAQQ